jgi:hypothetical protein
MNLLDEARKALSDGDTQMWEHDEEAKTCYLRALAYAAVELTECFALVIGRMAHNDKDEEEAKGE